MSRGEFWPKNQSRVVLKGCRSKGNTGKVPIIDVDDDKDEFVTVSVAENSHKSSGWFKRSMPKRNCPISNYINIDEESIPGNEEESDGHNISSTTPSSSSSHICDGNDDDDDISVIFVKKGKTDQDLSGKANIAYCSGSDSPDFHGVFVSDEPVDKSFDLSSSESDVAENDETDAVTSDSDTSDCEIIDGSFATVCEEWQKAASKKRNQNRTENVSEGHVTTSAPSSESGNAFFELNQENDACNYINTELENNVCKQKDVSEPRHDFCKKSLESCKNDPLVGGTGSTVCFSMDATDREWANIFKQTENVPQNEGLEPPDGILSRSQEISKSVPLVQGSNSANFLFHPKGVGFGHRSGISLIGDREKHKESEEYRRATEEEWSARQEQLRIQAEEARRMRKRKKAETLRLLDMEKRQKQRLEEVRESQKKNEETLNLKEQLRAEVRKQLDLMEFRYRDMASLLRALGIKVSGGRTPSPQEVNSAYKQALLKFHPDRASRTDVRLQVESEEKFKLISRLKGTLLLAAR